MPEGQGRGMGGFVLMGGGGGMDNDMPVVLGWFVNWFLRRG